MNQIQLTSIAIMLQKSLGHSAGDIPLEEVPRLLEKAPLEAIEQACSDWTEARKKVVAAEAAIDSVLSEYGSKAPESLLRDLLKALEEAKRLESAPDEALMGLTQPWFEACGSPEWVGIFMPKLQYSTPRGSVHWDLTGAKPRVWIERSKPGKAGMGDPGEEVVTYDVLTGRLHWSERAEARHMSEMANLLREVDPQASKEAKELHAKWSILEIRSAFRRAQLAIPVSDPEWDRKWNLLEMGVQAAEKAAVSGTYYGPGIVEYFRTWEKARVFLDEVGATALAS